MPRDDASPRTAYAPASLNRPRRPRVEGRIVLRILPLVPSLLLAGCPCAVKNLDRWVYDDWEDCAGLCGWTVVEGEAQVVQTFHSAEHALRLGGPRTVARRPLDPGTRTCSEPDCTMRFGAVTSCWDDSTGDGVPRLGVQILYLDSAGAEVGRAVELNCTTAGGTLRFCEGEVPLGLEDPGGGDPWPPSALVLEGTLDGCIVDELVLESFWLFCGA